MNRTNARKGSNVDLMWSLATGLLLCIVVGQARAEDLPKAETILDRYIEVTGGKANYEKLKNSVHEMTVESPMGAMKLKSYQAVPDRLYITVDVPNFGVVEQGYDKNVAWDKNKMSGARIRTGSEMEQLKQQAVFNSDLKWRELYKEAKTVGVEDVEGKPAHKVEMTPKEGDGETHFYDKASGLRVKVSSKQKSPMGEATVEQFFTDYKDVNGIKVAHKIVSKGGPQTTTIVINKVEFNADIPADRFDLPADVKALADAEKGGKPEEKKPEEKKP